MPTWEYKGKQYELDEDGFLQDWEGWEEGMAEEMAKKDGVVLGEEHWKVLRYLRDYFIKYQVAAPIKMLVKEMAKMLGPEKGKTKYIYELFPGGPAMMACRYAGLPKPTGCV